jgi:hypothetical protein
MTKLRQRQRKKKRVALENMQRARDRAEMERWRKRDAEKINEIVKMENERLAQMYGVKDRYEVSEVEEMVKQLEAEGAYANYDQDAPELIVDIPCDRSARN